MQLSDVLIMGAGLFAIGATAALWRGATRKIRTEEYPIQELPPRSRDGSGAPEIAA